jgi:hypothetical protein
MQITTIGLDIAKNVFQVHGIDAKEKVVARKQLRRSQVITFFKALPPCLIGMEACATAHYWARELTKLGHEVRLMPAKDVNAAAGFDRGQAEARTDLQTGRSLSVQLIHRRCSRRDPRLCRRRHRHGTAVIGGAFVTPSQVGGAMPGAHRRFTSIPRLAMQSPDACFGDASRWDQGSWPDSPATLQGIPGECLRFTDQLAHSCAQLHALFRVAAVTKISVALAFGCSGALSASVFSASRAAVNGRRATWLAGSRSSPAAPSLAQSHRFGVWVHRVVRHFQVSPSDGALFTIPTTPWAPG